jgi:(p)ppGpp synthase/HD superfamily hydrolase
MPKERVLTSRFDEAYAYAARLHADQARKGTNIPYLSHLLAVASLVLEDGGSEDEAIAALLHDAVEDQGGQETLAEIRNLFGGRVAGIARIRQASSEVRRVSMADKLHNARSILRDYRVLGEGLWERFNAGKDDQLWYYRELVKAFREEGQSPMVDELNQVVSELEQLA